MEWLTNYLEEFTYVGIVVALMLAGLGLPIPEDIPLIFGGVMAGMGKINVWAHFGLSMLFILLGDSCLFFIGRRISRSAGVSGWWGRILTRSRQERVARWFTRYGNWAVFFGRFVAGLRGAVFLSAGLSGFAFPRFLLMDALAALVSVPVWIWLGVKFGENWTVILETAALWQRSIIGGLLGVGLLGYLGFSYWKKRRAIQTTD